MPFSQSLKRPVWKRIAQACLLAMLGLFNDLAHASLPPAKRTCFHVSAQLEVLDRAKDRAAALRTLLAQPAADSECIGRFLAKGAAPGDATTLTSLMLAGGEVPLRRNAANALGEWHTVSLPTFKALSTELSREEDPTVAGARIASLGRLMVFAVNAPWSDDVSILSVIESIGNSSASWDGSMATINRQRIEALRNIAYHALTMYYNADYNVHDHDTRPGAAAVADARKNPKVSAAIAYGIFASLNDAPDESRVSALYLLAQIASHKYLAGNGPDFSSYYMRRLLPLLSAPAPEVRGAAGSAVSAALLVHASRVDHVWQDFSPMLGSGLVDQLLDGLGKALADPSTQVRREAARGLSALMRFRPRHVEALVTLLSDADAEVRSSAAMSLAQVPVLPDRALAALQSMAGGGNNEAISATIALSNHPTPAVIATLIGVLGRPQPPHSMALANGGSLMLPSDLHDTVQRALRKVGRAAALPLLAHIAATTTTDQRDRVFATLEAIGWRRAVADGSELVAVLAPAVSAADPEVRAMALSLFALYRPYAAQPYPDALVEMASKTYLSIPEHEAPKTPTHSDSFAMFPQRDKTETHDRGWAREPQVSAATLAGNSRSPQAAQRMVDWMCSGRRLETANVRTADLSEGLLLDGQLHTIQDSLGTIGAPAVIPVVNALSKGASRHCARTLFDALNEMDLSGNDEAAMARMLAALNSKVPGLRLAIVYKLSQTPDLPGTLRAPLLALARGADMNEAMMAVLALRRLASPVDVTRHRLYAPAVAMTPALNWMADAPGPTLHILKGEELQSAQASVRRSLAAGRRLNSGLELDNRLASIRMAGIMGRAVESAVPDLVSTLQAPEAQLREEAASSLGLIGAPAALPALLAAIQAYPGTTLAHRAQVAIRRIGPVIAPKTDAVNIP